MRPNFELENETENLETSSTLSKGVIGESLITPC